MVSLRKHRWATAICAALGTWACHSSSLPPPLIDSVTPQAWKQNESPVLTIHGSRFFVALTEHAADGPRVADRFEVRLSGVPLLDVRWVSNSEVVGTAPATLPIGFYDVELTTPSGDVGRLPLGVEVQAPSNTNGGGNPPYGGLEAVGAAQPMSAVGQSVYVMGDTALLGYAEGGSRVVLLDVSLPSAPRELGTFSTFNLTSAGLNGYVVDIAALGHYAYLATMTGGLVAMDWSTPAQPSFAGGLELTGETWAVEARDNTVYVGNRTRLVVVDVTDPSTPTEIGSLNVGGGTNDVAIVGNLLLAASLTTVQAVDITDPSAPTVLGQIDPPPFQLAYEIWVSPRGTLAFVVDKTAWSLFRVDYADPTHLLATLVDEGDTDFRTVDGTGSAIYVGTGDDTHGALRAYDLTASGEVSFRGEYPLPSKIYEVMVVGGLIYASCQDGQLRVFRDTQ